MFTDFILYSNKFRKLYQLKRKEIMDKYALTANEINVLLFLGNNPEFDTANKIVELRNLPKSQVSKSVEHLIKLGYLTTEQDDRDRRCIHLKIQKKAFIIVEEAKKMQKDYVTLIFKGLSSQQKDLFNEVVNHMYQNVEEALENVA